MKTKKILSFVISLAMFLSVLPVNRITVSAAASFGGGSGTEADPYIISTVDHLKSFRDDVNGGDDYSGKYIRLTKNINLGGSESDQWTPIGNRDNSFNGTFDGSGYRISGLYIKKTKTQYGPIYVGLFGYSEGTIKDLGVSGEVTGYSAIGGVVGGNSGTIERCYSSVTVDSSERAGGITGQNSGNIRDCYNAGTVSGDQEVGGIVGALTNGGIENCYNSGKISGTSNVGAIIGGLSIGRSYDNYYLTGTAAGGVNGGDYGTSSKTAAEFESGEVAYKLQKNSSTFIWGQKLSGSDKEPYPTLTSDSAKKVYAVTFMLKDSTAESGYKEYAVQYANASNESDYFPANPTGMGAYTFLHWVKSKDISAVPFRYSDPVSGDMTLYAVGKENTTGTEADSNVKLKQQEAVSVDLNDFVANKSGSTQKNFTFSLADGTLPDGLSFQNGTITGTPISAGKSTVKFSVANNGIALMSAYDDTSNELTLTLDVGLQGDGTEANPYKILDLSSITYLRDDVNSGNDYGVVNNGIKKSEYIKLMTDIDLGGSDANQWIPIGGVGTRGQFRGIFDGNGHKITGLYINKREDYAGLFGKVDNIGGVRNLSVSGTVKGWSYAGGIVGSNNNGTIENCFSDVSVTGTGIYIGGIAGYNNSGAIKNCVNVGTVKGGSYIGSIAGSVGDFGQVDNCYYLTGTAAGGINGGDNGTSSKTAAEFASGDVAHRLPREVWGQKLSGTGNDLYPTLTSDTAKKVYKVSLMTNEDDETNYRELSGIYGNKDDTVSLPVLSSEMFRGWSETKGGDKLGNTYTVSGDVELYSLWKKDITFTVSGTNHVYKADTPREITAVPSAQDIPDSDISVKYYAVDENSGELKSVSPVTNAITVGKYLYVIDITGDSTDKYSIKRKYAVTNTALPVISDYDNIGFMYISATAEQQDVFSIEDVPESVYYGDSFTVSPYGASGTVTYEITDGNSIASIDAVSGEVTISGVGKVTIRAKSTLDGFEDRYAVRSFAAKKRVLTPTATAENRKYNGENGVQVSVSLENIANNDEISAAASGSMINADAGNGKIVYVSNITLSGGKKDLYTLSSAALQTTVNIEPIEITGFSISAESKKYDGTTNAQATVTDIIGVLGADAGQVQIIGNAEFDSADSADGKTVKLIARGLTGAKSANYAFTALEATATADIKPLNIDFVIGQTSFIYDGTEKTLAVSASDENGRIFRDYQINYTDESGITVIPSETGTYTAEIVLNDTVNYTTSQSSVTVKVGEATQDSLFITGLPGTVRYGDSFALTSVGGKDGGTYEWTVNNANVTLSSTDSAVTTVTIGNAVGQNVEISVVKRSDNYRDVSAKVIFVPVAKDVTFDISNLEQTYGNITAVNVVPSDQSATYDITYNGTPDIPAEAGTYTVEVSANGNYKGVQRATLIINKATPDGGISGIQNSYTYGDSIAASAVNLTAGADWAITYAGTGIYIPQAEPPKNAGSYTAILTISGDNFETVTKTQNFVIEKAPLRVWAKNETRAYGEANPIFEIEYDASDFKYGDTKAVVLAEPVASTIANASSPVGQYNVTLSGGIVENYRFEYLNDENDNLGVLTIVGATGGQLIITGASNTTSVGQSFMLYAFYGKSKVDVTWASSDPSVAEISADGTVTTLKPGDVTFTATADENYSGATATFTLRVEKAYINLYAADTVKTYNGDVQSVTLISGNAGFTPILSGADKNVDVTYTLITDSSVTEPKNAGTYAVSFTVTDERYSGGGNATLHINKANITVKAKDISKEYGEDPQYELEIVGGDSNAATAAEMINYVTFASDGADKKAKADTYDINVALTSTGDDNRSFAVSDQKGTLTVTKAPLTIKAKDVVREYGATNPALEAEYIGFKNGETKDVLTGELALSYNADINEQTPIGEHSNATTASGVSADNYDITFAVGKVTVTKIGVRASAGTTRTSYIVINLDKPIDGLGIANFEVKNGEDAVTLTDVTASNNKTYTLKGNFSTSVTYTITPNLTGTAAENTHEIISAPLSVRPSSGSGGGSTGGGGGGAATYYTVKFETNGGGTINNVKVEKNKTVAEPEKPVKDGFVFDGWYIDKDLKTAYDFAEKVVKNFTLYAKWTAEETKPDKPSGSEWKNPFTDVSEDDWFCKDVEYVNKNGLMNGVSDTFFEPNSPLTRSMFVTILWRAEGEPQTDYAMTFTDVDANSYYAEAVRWAASEKIVSGYSETEFAPNEKITREQLAAIMFRYAGCKGLLPNGDWAINLDYADLEKISDWAYESVMYCKLKGIMQGKDNNMFAPQDNTTRAESAAILQRFLENK